MSAVCAADGKRRGIASPTYAHATAKPTFAMLRTATAGPSSKDRACRARVRRYSVWTLIHKYTRCKRAIPILRRLVCGRDQPRSCRCQTDYAVTWRISCGSRRGVEFVGRQAIDR